MRSKTKRQTQTLCQGTHTVERKGQQVGLGQGHTMATPAMVMAIVAKDSSMGDLSHIVVLATTADSTT